MLGKKRGKQFYQKHTNSASKKCRKKSTGKRANNVFYIHTNIVTQKGGKSAKHVFQKHTNSLCKKCSKIKRLNNGKNVFLYSHEYRDQKRGGKNA